MGKINVTEEEYREAYLRWKEEHPNELVKHSTKIELNGKTITLGKRISNMRQIYKAMQEGRKYGAYNDLTEEQISWWTDNGIDLSPQVITEEEYREAYLKWKEEHSNEKVSESTTVELNGKIIGLGTRIKNMRQICKAMQEGKKTSAGAYLTEEQISWWTDNGIDLSPQKEEKSEKEYREAYLKWKEEHPNEKPKPDLNIELNGKNITLGTRISNMRRIYKAMQEGRKIKDRYLTEEQISWWTNNGIDLNSQVITEEEYREAYLSWKEKHPNELVSKRITVELNGTTINLGVRINNMRQIYKAMQEGRKYGAYNDLTEEQISWWTDNGIDLNPQKESISEEEYREAYLSWKEEHPNENPKHDLKIELNGKIIGLGKRIKTMRQIYKAMQEGRKCGTNNNLTEEQINWWTDNGIDLNPQVITEEEYREAYLSWKEKRPNENPKHGLEIELNEKIIGLGYRISIMRQIYKAMQEGRKFGTYNDLTEEQINWWTEHGMIWDYQKWKQEQKEKKRLEKIDQEKSTYSQRKYNLVSSTENSSERKVSTLEKYTEIFQGNEKKAQHVIECLDDLRKRRSSKKKEEYNIDNILKEFDVDLETLEKYLSRARTKEVFTRDKPLMHEGETLRKFCIDNGYNYEVVSRAIKLHQFCEHDSLEQLINRSLTTYQKKGQQEPATWIYEKYGHLVKHVLLELNLDASSILNHMSNYTVSLEEAIRHNVFLRTREKREHDWLEELYNYLVEEVDSSKEEGQTIDDIVNKYQYLVEEYQLDFEEHQILSTAFFRYLNTIKEYGILDVGLENNQVKKLQKIKDYGLEELDIEESFFVPLKFDKGVLLGRKSELYKRRQLLRQYIIDWDYYSDLEKEQIKLQNNFTTEEISFIEKTRNQINETVSRSL